MISAETYAVYRAACDKAEAYRQANATFSRGGWSSMSAELAAHPDYAGCTNDMRGAIEEYELNRDQPDAFSAYITDKGLTLWTGVPIGKVTGCGTWRRNNFGGKWRAVNVRAAWGQAYYGREYDSRQLVNLRRVA